MARFLARKIGNIRELPRACLPVGGTPGNQIVVPRSEPCTENLDFGAQRMVTLRRVRYVGGCGSK